MVAQQHLTAFALCGSKRTVVLLGRVATHIVVVHKVGSSHNVNGSLRGTTHLYTVGMIGDDAIALDIHLTLSRQTSRHALVLDATHSGRQRVVAHAVGSGQQTFVRDLEPKGFLLVGIQAHHDHIVGQRRIGATGVSHTVGLVADMVHGRSQIELTAVIAHLLHAGELDKHTSQQQIFHAKGLLDEVLVDQLGSLLLLIIEYQPAHLSQMTECLGGIVIVGSTRPKGLFVQLHFLTLGASIDHSTHVRVAYWQCLMPVGCGLLIPKFVLLCVCVEADGQQQEGKKHSTHDVCF